MVCTPAGLPVTWALAHPRLDERQVLVTVLDRDRHLLTERPGLLLIADNGYTCVELDAYLHAPGADLLRPAYRHHAPRPGQALLAPIRQLIESVYGTVKGQLDRDCTAAPACWGVAPASPNAYSPSPPRSGATGPPGSPPPDP